MSDAPATIMTRLREETRDLHASAEGKAFQRRMLSGELSREEYVAWLGQMLLVHRALEAHLRRLWQTDPAFAALREEQFQEPYLLADLAALDDASGGHAPLAATAALIADIERAAVETPLALLGHHYVLEGSNNGNRYIVRRLAPALGIAHGAGRPLPRSLRRGAAGPLGALQAGHGGGRLRQRAGGPARRRRAAHVRGHRRDQRRTRSDAAYLTTSSLPALRTPSISRT